MYEMENLEKVAENIKRIDSEHKKFCEELTKNEIELKIGGVIENKVKYKIERENISEIKVLAIDGGCCKRNFIGMDACLIKTSAVLCKYVNGKLVKTEYFPKREKIFFSYLDENDENSYFGLKRNIEEIKTAIDAFKKFNPDILLLDGSIIPHNSERPLRNSTNWEDYQLLIRYLNELYEICKNKIVGCIKDSRGKRFLDIISNNIPELNINVLKHSNDTIFLNHILRYSERTCVFRFAKGEHYILNDLGVKDNIFCFYLSAAENDFPMRIEFWDTGEKEKIIENANKISKIILMLCKHAGYSVPAPLIEADLRARLNEIDAEKIFNHVLNLSGFSTSIMKRRRDNRPF